MELPVYKGTIGPDVIDIRKLYAQTGKFTYDPGFLSTAVCNSTITYIDGDKGELLYRGYPIEQLATQLRLPRDLLPAAVRRAAERRRRRRTSTTLVTNHTMVNEQMQFFLRGFRRDAHPMAVMTGLVGALSAFYHDSHRHQQPEAPRDLGDPPDRQDADAGGDGLQVHDRPAVHLPEERPVVRRPTSCA